MGFNKIYQKILIILSIFEEVRSNIKNFHSNDGRWYGCVPNALSIIIAQSSQQMSFSQLFIWEYGYQAPVVTGPFYQQGLLQLQDPKSLPAYFEVNLIWQWASPSVAHDEWWTVDVWQWSITLSAVSKWIILSWMESISSVIASLSLSLSPSVIFFKHTPLDGWVYTITLQRLSSKATWIWITFR